jgi:hypothetical protein
VSVVATIRIARSSWEAKIITPPVVFLRAFTLVVLITKTGDAAAQHQRAKILRSRHIWLVFHTEGWAVCTPSIVIMHKRD